ncbi:MAG TPA: hypothetical protein VN578_00805 [Candidatus Binatia bacterium]|jgi:hypothetical protein|nr:hypothetical protein [Candidatus Binatia bacterium]
MKDMQNPEKTVRRSLVGALAVLVAFGANALADPILTSVTVGPQSPDPILQGSNATFVVTVSRTGHGKMEIYLSAAGLPAGATAAFSPNPIKFTGKPITSATASLVVSTTSTTPPGPSPFSVLAADGGSPNQQTNTGTLDVATLCPGVTRMANGGMCIVLPSAPGQPCCIQAATNLSAPVWTTICTTNTGTNSLLVYADMDASKYPCRFYRLSVP